MTRLFATCLCGPRHSSAPKMFARISDAVVSSKSAVRADPTGTTPLQRRWSKELDRRWSTIKKMLPDVINSKLHPTSMIAHAQITGQDPIRAFQGWIDEAMRSIVIGNNPGFWMLNFVRNASDMGAAHGRSAIKKDGSDLVADRTQPLQTLATTELQGIVEAVSQQLVRVFANGVLTKVPRSQLTNQMRTVIDKVGVQRGHLLVSFMVVRAFTFATVDALRGAGVQKVSILPERVVSTPVITTDAKKSLKGQVDVMTADDDRVCPECEDIAAEGPYYLDEVEKLIPAHPRCRCALVPADEEEFEQYVEEKEFEDSDFDESKHPRDEKGRWVVTVMVTQNGEETQRSIIAHDVPKSLAGKKATDIYRNKGFSKVKVVSIEEHKPPKKTEDAADASHLTSRYGIRNAFDEFKEEDHPRDKDGKFTFAGGSGLDIVNAIKSQLPANTVSTYHPGEHEHPELKNHFGIEVNAGKDQLSVLAAAAKQGVDLKELEYSGPNEELLGGIKVYQVPNPSPSSAPTSLKMSDLAKIAGKKGSNEGGVYTNKDGTGDQYYIKTPPTPDHVTNELMSAKLYQLAGVQTMQYVPVEGGKNVATVLQPLDKNNIKHFNADERHEAQKDFAIHAWLANWDAAGTGGDNQVIVNGKVATVDTGGSLKYRAQGAAKGDEFGDKVNETNTLRDPNKSPDAADLYGNMTNAQIVESIKRVTDIPDHAIIDTVVKAGGNMEMADKLIKRKYDLAEQAAKMTTVSTPTPVAPIQVGPYTVEPSPGATETAGHGFKNASEYIKHQLLKGTTANEMKQTLNWKAMTVPGNAKALGLKLEMTKQGKETIYKGTPMTVTEIMAANPDMHQSKAQALAAKAAMPPEKAAGGKAKAEQNYTALAAKIEAAKPKVEAPAPKVNGSKPEDIVNAAKAADMTVNLSEHKDNNNEWQISASTMHAEPLAKLAKQHPEWTLKEGMKATYTAPKSAFGDNNNNAKPANPPVPAPAAPAPAPVPAKSSTPATQAELDKAKKNVKLQSQYVPGFVDHPEAHKALAEFNTKYEGKNLNPDQLQGKVDDFKALQASMVPLQSAAQKLQAEQTAAAKAAAAAAEAQTIKGQVKAEIAAKASTSKDDLDNAAVKAVGVSVNSGDYYNSQLKHMNVELTPAQSAAVAAYVGSKYDKLNAVLRKGKNMDVAHVKFAKVLDDALAKMPQHVGYAQRGIKHDPGGKIFEHYANLVGAATMETAFSSAGTDHKLWGETTLHIESKHAADISKLNSEGGGEVIFRPGTWFHVKKINANTREVWLEEI